MTSDKEEPATWQMKIYKRLFSKSYAFR
jgi:hypothetical protein